MKKIKINSVVNVDYEGRLENGKWFDTSIEDTAKKEGIYNEGRKYEPLHFTIGQGSVIKGFEEALIGMKEGEEKTLDIKSSEAYGESKPELIKSFDRDPEKDKALQVGMVVMVNLSERQFPAKVIEVSDKISLDFNHPLAGKTLKFKIKVIKIED